MKFVDEQGTSKSWNDINFWKPTENQVDIVCGYPEDTENKYFLGEEWVSRRYCRCGFVLEHFYK